MSDEDVEPGVEDGGDVNPISRFFENLPSGPEESEEQNSSEVERDDLQPYFVNGEEVPLPKNVISLLEQGRRFQSEKDRLAAENAQLKAQADVLFKQQERFLNGSQPNQPTPQPKSGLPPALAMVADKIGGATGFPDEFKALMEAIAEELDGRDSKIVEAQKQVMDMLAKQQELLGHVSSHTQDQEILRRGWEAVQYQANEEGLTLSQAEREAVATRFYQLQKMEGHSEKTQDTDFQMAWLEAERERSKAAQPRIPRIPTGVRPPAASPFTGLRPGVGASSGKRPLDGLTAFRQS